MKGYLLIKRILDFIFALVLLVVLLPLILFCAILIKIEDPHKSFIFSQKRLGKTNKVFKVFKIRTMRSEVEIDGRELSDSERMLKVGNILRKLSLDELPQLINIIKGEMSFIGPRPLPVEYLPYFKKEELERHSIYPGMSGWAQVNGRNYLSWDDVFKYDLEYVNNISFTFDVKILILTIKKIFLRSDVGVRGVDFEDKSLYDIREPNNT